MYDQKLNAELIHSFQGHKASIFSIAESVDQSRFFSGDGNGYLVEWDFKNPDNGIAIAQLPSNIFSIKYIADKQMIAVGTLSGTLFFLDYVSRKLIKSVEHHRDGIFHIWRSDDLLYVCGGDGQLSLWDLNDLSICQSIQVSDKSLRSLDFSLEREQIAIGSSDHDIHLYSFRDLKKVSVLSGHENSVFCVHYNPEGDRLYSGSRDAQIKIWDTVATEQIHSLPAHMSTVNSLAMHPSLPLLASASRDKTIKIWDTDRDKLLKVISAEKQTAHKHSVNKLLWSGYENILISAGDDRGLLAWRIERTA